MRRGCRRFIGVGFACVVMATPAAGPAEPLELVTGNNYLPFTDEDLPQGGMATAIVRAVYAEIGREITVDFLPWKRGYIQARRGTYAGIFPYVRTEERAAEFHFSNPILEIEQRPIVMADSDLTVSTPSDLAGTRYCLPKGYAPARTVARMTDAGKVTRRKPLDMQQCFRMLQRGRVDFIPISVLLAQYTSNTLFGRSDRVGLTDLVLETTPLHMIFPKGEPKSKDRLRRFNAGLRRVRQSGQYEAIVERFRSVDAGTE